MAVKIIHVPGDITIAELKARMFGGHVVRIGFPAGPTEKDGTPVAMIAAVHEFGSDERGIPERSFLRSTLSTELAKYIKLNKTNLQRVVNGKIRMRHALELLGQVASGDVKKTIRAGAFTPLSPATIERKGSSAPLIDTGMMVQSVTYEVDE